MEENEKKQNNKLKRLIIGIILVCVSLTTGVIFGAKFTKLSNTITNGTSQTDQLINILKQNWYSEIYYGKDCNEDIIIDQFIGALSTSDEVRLDPYTYLKKNEVPQPVEETGKLGITISYYYNYPVIVDIEKNSPAFGTLKIGDIIVTTGKNHADEFSILDTDVNFSNILNLAVGKPGDNIYLKVARFDETNTLNYFNYELTLNKGSSITNYAYLEDEDIEDTIMVKLTSFVAGNSANNTCYQLKEILSKDDSKNLIIDIRDNGGGDLSSVIEICDLFLEKSKLVTTLEYKNNNKYDFYTSSNEKYDYENIIILQNGNTASASEILISTLLYYYPEKVTLVGQQSYGKGIAQRSVNVLNNHYVLQYTCAKWYRPDASWIGMRESKFVDGYQLGFSPLDEYTLTKNSLLSLMEKNNNYIFYKTADNAYKMDNVASQNKFFFEVYNLMNNTNIRTDHYFDESCLNAIKSYQESKNIEATGLMNEDTFIYFLKDFYDERINYSNLHLVKAKKIIEGE